MVPVTESVEELPLKISLRDMATPDAMGIVVWLNTFDRNDSCGGVHVVYIRLVIIKQRPFSEVVITTVTMNSIHIGSLHVSLSSVVTCEL